METLEYDYVVIGAGSAGAIVAARLTEDPGVTVLLLEAGPPDRGLMLRMPMGYGASFFDARVNWCYESEPEPGLGGRRIYVPRGRVLGGSSSINAMVYARGQPSDFAAWEARGNPGWGWREVLAAYCRMEDHAHGASPVHGTGGPVHISDVSSVAHPLSRRFVAAAGEIGIPTSTDLNGESIEGAGYYGITVRDGLRVSTARAYLRPARRRPGLCIETGAVARRICLSEGRATGVVFRRHGRTCEARARRAVVLSAGALGSPHILQLSGIGPGAALQAAGVEVLHDLAGVGRNLHDHACYDQVFRTREPSLNATFASPLSRIAAGLRWLATGTGPLALSLNQAGGFFRSDPALNHPDMQLYFQPLSYATRRRDRRELLRPDPFPGIRISVSPCKPESRGEVLLRGPDPDRSPAIRLNLLDTEGDRDRMLAGVRAIHQLQATDQLGSVIEERLEPKGRLDDEAAIRADMAARAYSVFHPVGSCRMGPDPRIDVVDPRLRVHGVRGLYVIDASIFPEITSGNTNAPAMMVGEKGAEILREDFRG